MAIETTVAASAEESKKAITIANSMGGPVVR